MKSLLSFTLALVFFAGCSATWNGVKEDTSHSVDWTKEQVNHGAAYVKEKTE
jgi:PBP1b-binding outer membrane lipoprotein LpoB